MRPEAATAHHRVTTTSHGVAMRAARCSIDARREGKRERAAAFARFRTPGFKGTIDGTLCTSLPCDARRYAVRRQPGAALCAARRAVSPAHRAGGLAARRAVAHARAPDRGVRRRARHRAPGGPA